MVLRKVSEYVSVLAVVVTIVGAITVFVRLQGASGAFQSAVREDMRAVAAAVADLGMRTQHLERQIADSRSQPATLKTLPMGRALSQMEQRSEDLESRLAAMEKALLTDPAKALALPLLQKDFENLTGRFDTEERRVRDELSRMYAFYNWFFGLMCTIVIAVVGLLIMQWRSAGPERPPKEP